jgi:hypothetical protein
MSGHRRDNGGRSNTRLLAYLATITLTFVFATGLVVGCRGWGDGAIVFPGRKTSSPGFLPIPGAGLGRRL